MPPVTVHGSARKNKNEVAIGRQGRGFAHIRPTISYVSGKEQQYSVRECTFPAAKVNGRSRPYGPRGITRGRTGKARTRQHSPAHATSKKRRTNSAKCG
jgi:hypothetical protein